jgi:hypothetical protein
MTPPVALVSVPLVTVKVALRNPASLVSSTVPWFTNPLATVNVV